MPRIPQIPVHKFVSESSRSVSIAAREPAKVAYQFPRQGFPVLMIAPMLPLMLPLHVL